MTQFKMFLVAALAVTAVPTLAQAGHDYRELTCAAERLHGSLIQFEQVAYSRHLSRYDQHRIHHATEEACELVEALKCGAPFGRIQAKAHCLSTTLQRLDVRLRRGCSLLRDRQLKCAWDRVLAADQKLTCLLETPYQHVPEIQTHFVPRNPHYAVPHSPQRNPHFARRGRPQIGLDPQVRLGSPARRGPDVRLGSPAREVPTRQGRGYGSVFDRYAEFRRAWGF